MLFSEWRKKKGLTLASASDYLDIPLSTLWGLEKGVGGVTFELMAKIEHGTQGKVKAQDVYREWLAHNPQLYQSILKRLQAARPAPAKSIRNRPKRPKEGKHGNGKSRRLR